MIIYLRLSGLLQDPLLIMLDFLVRTRWGQRCLENQTKNGGSKTKATCASPCLCLFGESCKCAKIRIEFSAPLSFVLHTECRVHVPRWLPRSPCCELASECLAAHLLPRQWHSLAACPRHVWVRAGPLMSSGLAMFVARQPIAEVVARLSRGRATTWLFL